MSAIVIVRFVGAAMPTLGALGVAAGLACLPSPACRATAGPGPDGRPTPAVPAGLVFLAGADGRLTARALPADDKAGPAPARWRVTVAVPRQAGAGERRPARPVSLPPPAWLPGQQGHAAFVARQADRPALVWLGASDGRLRAFDAATGAVLAAVAPPRFTTGAGEAPPSGPPCPAPQAADVRLLDGAWRTVLLCSVQLGGTPAAALALYVLDVTRVVAGSPPPAVLLARAASPALALTATGPLRALALGKPQQPRWHVMATTGPSASGDGPGLAMLPLDVGAPDLTLPLPREACPGGQQATAILAADVLEDTDGLARAAYAVDDQAQLWRWDLPVAETPGTGKPAACLHARPAPADPLAPQGTAAAPLIFPTASGPLVVYGHSSTVRAVADTGTPAQEARPLATVLAETTGAGSVLRRAGGTPASAASGWQLVLPHPGERVRHLLKAGPAHVAILTVDAARQPRGYLVGAGLGESIGSLGPGQAAAHYTTGRAVGPDAHLLVAQAAPRRRGDTPARAEAPQWEDAAYTLWSIDGGHATPLNRIYASRRKGRLGWRELIPAPAVETAP